MIIPFKITRSHLTTANCNTFTANEFSPLKLPPHHLCKAATKTFLAKRPLADPSASKALRNRNKEK